MQNHHHLRCRWRSRLILVVAGLLYLSGIAADPLVHAGVEQPTVTDVADARNGTGAPEHQAPVVPHGDSECLLCKVSGPLRIAEVNLRIGELPRAFRGTGPLVTIAPGPPPSSLTLPRAPPLF